MVPINEDNQDFWYAFKAKCRDLGIPYTRAMRQAAEAWMEQRDGSLTLPQPAAPTTDPFAAPGPYAEPVEKPELLRWEEPPYVTPPGGNPFA